ncbi:hypothetical protein PI124_g2357 [Phytophthora idaei]|nr:hypothetical protein PI125_g18010 [Phytophthora idaei]KAG3169695.1 hypothetical protein PI126_g2674 [Phytophthora idaei]KAG3253071.1 hypothetical protein PI124_g2357 [Phytophthora idaei]
MYMCHAIGIIINYNISSLREENKQSTTNASFIHPPPRFCCGSPRTWQRDARKPRQITGVSTLAYSGVVRALEFENQTGEEKRFLHSHKVTDNEANDDDDNVT